MKNYLLTVLMLLALITPSLADRDQISGSWNSSTGVFIVVGPPDDGGQFVMNIYKANSNELIAQVTAGWFDGPNFVYTIGGEQIVGLYLEENDTVEVQNRSGSFKSRWTRH